MILGQISDLHIKTDGKKSYRVVDTAESLRRCVAQVNSLKQRPDVLIITGDLVDFGKPSEYACLRELLAPLTMPYYLLPGNHDERNALRAAFPEHAYLQQGGERIEYVIEDYPVRLIALDSVIPRASGGEFSAATLLWLDEVLAQQPARPTVVAMHHPPLPPASVTWMTWAWQSRGAGGGGAQASAGRTHPVRSPAPLHPAAFWRHAGQHLSGRVAPGAAGPGPAGAVLLRHGAARLPVALVGCGHQ